jgi:hypothetical protein
VCKSSSGRRTEEEGEKVVLAGFLKRGTQIYLVALESHVLPALRLSLQPIYKISKPATGNNSFSDLRRRK